MSAKPAIPIRVLWGTASGEHLKCSGGSVHPHQRPESVSLVDVLERGCEAGRYPRFHTPGRVHEPYRGCGKLLQANCDFGLPKHVILDSLLA